MDQGSESGSSLRDISSLPYVQSQISGDFVAATVSAALLTPSMTDASLSSPLVVPGTVVVDETFDLKGASHGTIAAPKATSRCSKHGDTTIRLFPLFQLAAIIDLNTPDGKKYADVICTRLNNEAQDLWQHQDIYQDQIANVGLYADYLQLLQRLFKSRGKIEIPVRYGEYVPRAFSKVWGYVNHVWMDHKQIHMSFHFVWAGIWTQGETEFSSLQELGYQRRIRVVA